MFRMRGDTKRDRTSLGGPVASMDRLFLITSVRRVLFLVVWGGTVRIVQVLERREEYGVFH